MAWTTPDWRQRALDRLDQAWDLVVVGGGITGAGILAEATRAGLRAVLVEAGDFASGTSSRSSKMVHGGMRYLRQAQFGLTLQSVRERDQLLRSAPGLVERLPFLMTSFRGDRTPAWQFALGVLIYDLMALRWDYRQIAGPALLEMAPALSGSKVRRAVRFHDAQTDDARLVLRVLAEAVHQGAVAINYLQAVEPLRQQSGRVVGVAVRDLAGSGRTAEVRARLVVNATGAWADVLRDKIGARRRMRLIRGSHIAFPASRLSLPAALTMMHPRDNRAVFAIPWEGMTLVGTTDIDHGPRMEGEPTISAAEKDYLLELCRFAFPEAALEAGDVRTCYAGVRPVIDTGRKNPSKESREHAIWHENGLLTVAGGKLTTFRRMALDSLAAARKDLPHRTPDPTTPVLSDPDRTIAALEPLEPGLRRRLFGRHGAFAAEVIACGDPTERIADTPALWNELRWAARAEAVVHLEDLLLRRVRLGLLCERGGIGLMDRIQAVAQPELGWDDARWDQEEKSYRDKWRAMQG
jgi:glycerol-3-phosphate dehydrogenase